LFGNNSGFTVVIDYVNMLKLISIQPLASGSPRMEDQCIVPLT